MILFKHVYSAMILVSQTVYTILLFCRHAEFVVNCYILLCHAKNVTVK